MKAQAGGLSLIFGSHAHVPHGAAPQEFERVYEGHLRPFLASLNRHPGVHCALHYSGVLLHWIERTHHEIFLLIEEMVSRRQVEMLGGGFYEPVLPVIPAQDRIGQVELLATYIRRQFGRRPQGCRIGEHAWEQGLVSPLASCGMGFTFLSARQFELAGADRHLPCLCEDQGKLITVFPVSRGFGDKGVRRFLEEEASSAAAAAGNTAGDSVLAVFPPQPKVRGDKTQEQGWDRFLDELAQCRDIADTVLPGRLFKRLKGLKRAYIPDSSGETAALPARAFVIRHPEAGRLYSKMIQANTLVNQVRGDKARRTAAHEEMWKAQGGTLFCAGDRSGPFDAGLRGSAYRSILAAERITRDSGRFRPSLLQFDFNMDGEAEWLFSDVRLNCYVRASGGGIFELDYMPKAWNYLCTCRDRAAFADRFLPASAKAAGLVPGAAAGVRHCGGEQYGFGEPDKTRRKLSLTLAAPASGTACGIEIAKTYSVKKNTVTVRYALANSGGRPESFCFSPEIDLALPGGETEASARFFACKTGETSPAAVAPVAPSSPVALPLPLKTAGHGMDALKIQDIENEAQITLSASRPFDARVMPLYLDVKAGVPGAPNCEGKGLFQAFCVMPLLPVSLAPGKTWDAEFVLSFSH